MRKVSMAQITFFLFLFLVIVGGGAGLTGAVAGLVPSGDFRGIVLLGTAIVLIYSCAFLVYRIFLALMPLESGEVAVGSRREFAAQINTLFYLIFFYPLTCTRFVPVPVMRLLYLALGAKLGDNSYSGGVIMDPPLTTVGANSLIGHDAVVYAHVIEGQRLGLYPVRIGSGVTVGAHAIIMPGVAIGDGAIISSGAVVTKGCQVGANEIWAGVPARKIGMRQDEQAATPGG